MKSGRTKSEVYLDSNEGTARASYFEGYTGIRILARGREELRIANCGLGIAELGNSQSAIRNSKSTAGREQSSPPQANFGVLTLPEHPESDRARGKQKHTATSPG